MDLVVVGAGFTGLRAAAVAQEGHLKVVVLEASDRVGGRARTRPWPATSTGPAPPGLGADDGAQYIGDDHLRLHGLLHHVFGADYETTELCNGPALRWHAPAEVMLLGGRRYVYDSRRTSLPGVPNDLSPLGLAQVALGLVVWRLERLERRIDVVDPLASRFSAERIAWLDAHTVEDWLGERGLPKSVADLIRITVEAVFSLDASEISMLSFLWYAACNDGIMHAVEDAEGGPQQYWLKRGLGDLAQRYATSAKVDVRLGHQVHAISAAKVDGPVIVTAQQQGGEPVVLEAKRVVVAISPQVAGGITFDPELPDGVSAVLGPERWILGRTIKARLFYKEPWWRGSNGFAHNGYAGGTSYRVAWVMDNSVKDAEGVERFCLMTFTVARSVDERPNGKGHDQVLKDIVSGVKHLFNDVRAEHVVKVEIGGGGTRDGMLAWWDADTPFVPGGPNPQPKRETLVRHRFATALDAPLLHGRLLFASSELTLSRETAGKRTWDKDEREVRPRYAEGRLLHEITPRKDLCTRYSRLRPARGYVEGALAAGERAAAWALGAALEEPVAPAPFAGQEVDVELPKLKPLSSRDVRNGLRAFVDGLRRTAQAVAGRVPVRELTPDGFAMDVARMVWGELEWASSVAERETLAADLVGGDWRDDEASFVDRRQQLSERLRKARQKLGPGRTDEEGVLWEPTLRFACSLVREAEAIEGGESDPDSKLADLFDDLRDARAWLDQSVQGVVHRAKAAGLWRDDGHPRPGTRWTVFSPPLPE